MEFEWDDDKDAINQAKHGVSFEEAATIFFGPTYSTIDDRGYDEDRFITLGALSNNVVILMVVHTARDGRIRIISARKAKVHEQKKYYAEIFRNSR